MTGAICGAANNLIYGLTTGDNITLIYALTSLFNHNNETVLFSIGFITFYKEGTLFATRIGCNILNMLLAFGVFVLTTSPQDLVNELEKSGFSPKFGYVINSVFQILPLISPVVMITIENLKYKYPGTDRLADGTSEEVFAQDEVFKEARLQKPYMTQLMERFAKR